MQGHLNVKISLSFVVKQLLSTFTDSVLITYVPVSVVVDCERG